MLYHDISHLLYLYREKKNIRIALCATELFVVKSRIAPGPFRIFYLRQSHYFPAKRIKRSIIGSLCALLLNN